jgi:rod shape-determining protein MreB
MLFDWVYGMFSNDLAIDLGTATTLTFVRGRGIVANEPSVVAVQANSLGPKKVLAVGKEAKEMLGRTPGNIVAIRPMKDGVIADFEVTEAMLRYFIQKAHQRRTLVRPRVIVCVPSGITEVEKRAVRDSRPGRRRPRGLPDRGADGGGDRRRPADHRAVGQHDRRHRRRHHRGRGDRPGRHRLLSKSIRVAGDKMDEAIVQYIKRKYNLLIGERTAEVIKKEIGSAYPLEEPLTSRSRAATWSPACPRRWWSTPTRSARRCRSRSTRSSTRCARSLERTPPELSADIVDKGIVLSGGSAQLKNLDVLLREETGLPVMVCENPQLAVVLGTGRVLDELSLLREIALK